MEATKNSIQNLLGKPVDISDVSVNSPGTISRSAFDLYKETAIVAIASSNLYESYEPEKGALTRNQAIEAALLVRVAKFMSATMALLVDKVKEHGEVIMTLNRCIIESAVKLRFFTEKAKQRDFDDFVKSSLEPERNLYLTIQQSIEKRGETLPIETRMLNSINRVFKNSGVTNVDELKYIPRPKNYRSILKELNIESLYPVLQGVPSHSIHGTWVDLIQHHLEEHEMGFRPKTESKKPDPRLMCPISVVVLTAIKSYLNKYFPSSNEAIAVLLKRIDDLILRNMKVDSIHEQYLSQKQS